ncbi:hypothetical protein OG223_01450 [Streptomyces sp. NBC_01478]|uniref:hypothetical protein n=1 Tax=Streptomyces sp. NBC_01478 TaxID=2903882 RepID=UPI002E2F6E26|nr:hypothetical protein [Streptomyces sp. NBC_01478]
MTVADFAPLSAPSPARRPGGTGVDGPASLLTIRHFERTEVRLSEDGTARLGHHDTPAASCGHRYINP